jgi:signal transduction histidine kinase
LAVDTGIAALVLAGTLAMLAARGLGTPAPNVAALDATGVALGVLSALPLAARRFAPLTVYLLAAAAGVALAGLGYGYDAPAGPLIAAYSAAVVYSGARRAARRLAMLAVNLYVPATGLAYLARGVRVGELSLPLLAWALVLAGVWIAGDRSRLQREQIAELEQRARRIERDADRERRLAAAQERTRIARELHDAAGHAINVILVQAGAARLLHDRDPVRSLRAIATVEEVARDTIGEIDRLVRVLREDGGGELPADPAALDELLRLHRSAGLRVATELRGQRGPLPPGVTRAAYRILQEALTNAARHGGGSAEVAVWFHAQGVEITVTNPTTGVGGAGGGHGIVGMRERATLLGGTLDAAAEHGTFRLRAWLPHGEAAS